MFILSNNWNVALTGMLCLTPLLQSLKISDLRIIFSFVDMLLLNCPLYESEIFSYQRSSPFLFLRLKGYFFDSETLRFGRLSEMIESLTFCDNDIEDERVSPIKGNVRE